MKDKGFNFEKALSHSNFLQFIEPIVEKQVLNRRGKLVIARAKKGERQLITNKKEIAAHFGISRSTLIAWMRKCGYEDLIEEYRGGKKNKNDPMYKKVKQFGAKSKQLYIEAQEGKKR